MYVSLTVLPLPSLVFFVLPAPLVNAAGSVTLGMALLVVVVDEALDVVALVVVVIVLVLAALLLVVVLLLAVALLVLAVVEVFGVDVVFTEDVDDFLEDVDAFFVVLEVFLEVVEASLVVVALFSNDTTSKAGAEVLIGMDCTVSDSVEATADESLHGEDQWEYLSSQLRLTIIRWCPPP